MQTNADPLNEQVERLLSDLCIKLGFSEPLRHVPQFLAAVSSGPESFADLVLSVEGLDPLLNETLRQEARLLVTMHFVSWVGHCGA